MYKYGEIAGLDFETYSAVPLPEVGLKNYVEDPTFQPLMAAVAMPQATLHYELFDPHMRDEFVALMHDMNFTLTAHNAGFERAVLGTMGITRRVIDSAVVAAVCGANRHLRGAAQQLLDAKKLDDDGSLIRRFCMPARHQLDGGDLTWERALPTVFAYEWAEFIEYCKRDAVLSRDIVAQWAMPGGLMLSKEWEYAELTLEMNEAGWPIDYALVSMFRDRYRANIQNILWTFEKNVDAELNLNSHPQLVAWCKARGIRARSFDKEHVARMITRLEMQATLTNGELQVLEMLRTKQALGGSSLSKLDVILDVQHNGRVYDQYVHAGAGQSLRTSGRNVQMQNLKRLGPSVRDVSTVYDWSEPWTNEELAENMRQLFCAKNPNGLLFVADFASIESRALAWFAGERWKLDAYADGADLYVELAKQMYPSATTITKEKRTTGKVGELSCGYGAGPVAVQDFAAKMGLAMTEGEARTLVTDWREACPATVAFWAELQRMATYVVENNASTTTKVGSGTRNLVMRTVQAPKSLVKETSHDQSLVMELIEAGGINRVLMRRVFHGVHMNGRNIGYYKPSSLKSGPLWKSSYIDPKTKRPRNYEIYGGKIAGILTQSLCREIFFERLELLRSKLRTKTGCQIIGQFHDEVVVEWNPVVHGITTRELTILIEDTFSFTTIADFPMKVAVNSHWRYIK